MPEIPNPIDGIVMCARAGSNPGQMPYAVQLGACFECRANIWMAPSTVNLLLSMPKLRTLCEICAKADIDQREGPVALAIAPGAVEEMRAYEKKVGNN